MANNYEAMKLQMRNEFLKYDQAAMIEKFGLRSDPGNLCVTFLGTEYAVDRRTGAVRSERGEAGYNEAMTIYDVLCWSRPNCRASGQMVSMGSLSTLQSGSMKREGDGLFKRYEAAFDHRDAALAAACAKLGGVPEGKGDVACRIPLFPFLPVMLQYWDSDDEFPASLRLFTDEKILDFMHYETVWFALSHMLERIGELMERAAPLT